MGIHIDREERRKKISDRLRYRLENGMIEEVEFLLANYLSHSDLEYYGLEYKWIGRFLKGELSRSEMTDKLEIAIHQFAKRQMTWFRRMEKQGTKIHWLNHDLDKSEIEKTILGLLAN